MPLNNLRHGDTLTPFHKKWLDMKGRCYTKSKTSYPNYGAKGVTVSESWKRYENFKRDMYEKYVEHVETYGARQTTLDRIKVTGPYSKKNCRWATYAQQSENRRNTRYLIFNGQKKSLQQWAREVGLSHKLIANRLREKWLVKEALTIPKGKFTRRI